MSIRRAEFDSPSRRYGDVAHLGERLPCKQEAEGSSPSFSTDILRAMSSDIDFRAILHHITPLNVIKWIVVITAGALAIILVLWVAAQAWQSS